MNHREAITKRDHCSSTLMKIRVQLHVRGLRCVFFSTIVSIDHHLLYLLSAKVFLDHIFQKKLQISKESWAIFWVQPM